MKRENKHSAIFLDRDGVINDIVYHQDIGVLDTPFSLEQFKLLPGVARAIKDINDSSYLAILVSNQPGVAKEHFSLDIHNAIDQKMTVLLSEMGAYLDDRYYCLDHPEAILKEYRNDSEWRKPRPGMIIAACQKYGLSAESCWMIGDSVVDIIAAQAAGTRSVMIGKRQCYNCRLLFEKSATPDMFADNLNEAVSRIVGKMNEGEE
ncbi:HAD-IIIA family hydrolase [bacterium]|nr:HAD-IIIA family hydrolase [bacterium]